jgi:hypothetical protein
MKASTKPQEKAGRSLVDFNRAKRRSTCVVCQLPDEIRAQMRQAREKHIHRDVVVEWLEKEHRKKIAKTDLDAHTNGRHDDR